MVSPLLRIGAVIWAGSSSRIRIRSHEGVRELEEEVVWK
jgi:hypothetical protein